MEILKGIILWCILLAISTGGMTQEYFYKKYTASTYDTGNGIVQLPDFSYVVTGSSGGFDENSSQTYLMKVSEDGSHVWTKSYGGAGNDVGVKVMHIENEGFLIAGHSTSTADGGFDFVLYKVDEQGVLQWEKMYGGSNWEILHDAQLLQDGGAILVGQTEGATTQGTDVFMVRTDEFGDTLWTKTISTSGADVMYAIDTLSANEFVVGGQIDNTGVLAKFNIDGTQEWVESYNIDGELVIRDLSIFGQNIFAVGGIVVSSDEEHKRILKTDLHGVEEDYWVTLQLPNNMFTTVAVRDANSLFLCYTSNGDDLNPYPHGRDAFLIKFFTGLYFNDFSASFSSVGNDVLNEIILTTDGGVAIVGTSSDSDRLGESNYLGTDVMIIKIGPNDEVTVTPETGVDLVSINEEKKSDLFIYPNPVVDEVMIPGNVQGLPFEVVDFKGAVLISGEISDKLNVSALEAGVYFLRIKEPDVVWSARIIKQ